MKHLSIIVCMLVSLTAQAQVTTPFPQELRKSTVIDTA